MREEEKGLACFRKATGGLVVLTMSESTATWALAGGKPDT
jgi:hypothetical protein